jgi:hypothetical protein
MESYAKGEKALAKGETSRKALFVASNGAMKTAVANDPYAIGYVSVGHMDESTAPVALSVPFSLGISFVAAILEGTQMPWIYPEVKNNGYALQEHWCWNRRCCCAMNPPVVHWIQMQPVSLRNFWFSSNRNARFWWFPIIRNRFIASQT